MKSPTMTGWLVVVVTVVLVVLALITANGQVPADSVTMVECRIDASIAENSLKTLKGALAKTIVERDAARAELEAARAELKVLREKSE